MNKKQYAVAIDGPSGAGKSTLARAAAERLGILYVDTGAIYRTIGLYVRRRGIDPKDTAAVLAALPDIRIGMDHDADGMQRMLLNGEDVTADIRLPEISMYASAVSAIQGVRDFIMDGRDIGTVVLPDADVKIFLYADVEVRAKRRELELHYQPQFDADGAAVGAEALLRFRHPEYGMVYPPLVVELAAQAYPWVRL